jgi:hypothetical protein
MVFHRAHAVEALVCVMWLSEDNAIMNVYIMSANNQIILK